LQEIGHARSVECDGCDEACLEDVVLVGEGTDTRAYVVCSKRDDIGRVPVPLRRLLQWRVDVRALAETLAGLMGAAGEVDELVHGQLWWLGRVGFRAGQLDTFLARGTTLADGLDAIASAPRFQGCSRAVLLTLSDVSPEAFPGKVSIGLSRVLAIDEDGLDIDAQCVDDEVARRAGQTTRGAARFPTPPGTTWERVKIVIAADGDAAQVTAGNITEPMTPDRMGLSHKRDPYRFTEQWHLLAQLAKVHRIIRGSRHWSKDVPKRLQRLRRDLQSFFGIEGVPFHPSRLIGGYEPRFHLSHVHPDDE